MAIPRDPNRITAEFVNSTLRWANGLAGKIDRLLLPLTKKTKRSRAIAKLKGVAGQINKTRDAVVHSGEFRDEDEATETIEKTRHFIESLIHLYEPTFKLRDRKKRGSS